MRQLTRGISLLGIFAMSFSLTSCMDENPWGNKVDDTGTIVLSLTTDESINTSKPLFRSGEEDVTNPAETTKNLSDYTQNNPVIDKFKITIEKADGLKGSQTWTWETYSEFKEKMASTTFPVGSYTITATYGEKNQHGFDAPYLEGRKTFSVLAGRESNIALEAELANSMAIITYTDNFKNYMADCHASFSTPGNVENLVYTKDETRAAFIVPGAKTEASKLNVHFTTKKGKTNDIEVNSFTPIAKNLHNIKLDIKQNGDYDDAKLTITFDDKAAGEETIEIDMTQALAPGPEITCDGFENNQHLDMSENEISKLGMTVKVPAGFTSAELSIVSDPANSLAWLTDNKIDLCAVTDDSQLKADGLAVNGFAGDIPKTNAFAFIDFTKLLEKLPTGKHTISLLVTDKNGNTKTATVIVDSQEVSANYIENITPAATYASNELTVAVDYTGKTPEELTFFAQNPDNTWQILSVTSTKATTSSSTRAYEAKQCIYHLSGISIKSHQVNIRAYRNYKDGDENDESKAIVSFPVKVNVPEYTISAHDAFSKFAYLQITPKNPDDLKVISENLKLTSDKGDINFTCDANGIVIITGLTSGTDYALKSKITEDDQWGSVYGISTEKELAIPNGDFSESDIKLESGTLDVGGQWHPMLGTNRQIKSSFSHQVSKTWATINKKTAWSGSIPRNTWYVVPSSWIEGEKAIIRNVGFSHSGRELNNTGSTANTTYYCTDTPSNEELEKAAGELFLGSYSFNGSENRTEGTAFASRPTYISFDYTYSLEEKEKKADNGLVVVKILDSQNNVIAKSDDVLLSAGTETAKSISLIYDPFNGKASKLYICFKSSNQATPPIHIPTGTELNEGLKTYLGDNKGVFNIAANTYHAVATGSVLTIDNVTAHYDDAPAAANAPKRTSNKR